MPLSASGLTLLQELVPYRIGCAEVSEYPAAQLLDETVTVCRYSLSPDSVAVLRRAARRLYAWAEPDLPNDLCLMRGSEPWLITMAADHAASLIISPGELDRLQARVPGLAVRPSRTEPPHGIDLSAAVVDLRRMREAMEPEAKATIVSEWTAKVLDTQEMIGSDRTDDVVRDLAHDLLSYEPDPAVRREDKSLIGDEDLDQLLDDALGELAEPSKSVGE